MMFIIYLYIFLFAIVYITLLIATKGNHKKVIGIFLILISLLLSLATMDLALWGFISSIIATVLYLISVDFLFISFGIEKNSTTQYKLSNLKTFILILTPLLFLSAYFFSLDMFPQIKDIGSEKISYLYKIDKSNSIELFYQENYLKANYISYNFSQKPYIQISKFKDNIKQDIEYTTLIKDSDLVAYIGAKEYKVSYISSGSESNTVWLELYNQDSSIFLKYLLISIFRFYFVIISFLGVIKIFSMFETKIYKYICYKLGMNEKIIAIQGKWYQVNKYAVSNREYYLSSYSFQIRGNKLFSNKQQYNLKIKKEDIFFEEKNKKIKICFLEDSSRIKIGSNYFKNAASLNIKSYSLIRKIKNRIYYRLENQSNIFTYPSLEHVLYLDTNKKEIVETRNKNRFGYKNKYSKKDLELKKIRYECKDDTLFFYNEQQKCIGRYERIKIDE